ncbi:autoinducer-2 (AI-2) modifying protein LsrG (plasmid) [Streptomyces sp. YIM 121038]|uniref:putative quinol monooxygenase n=1 Tax=Streptomyces sp. YIM 121038 TaxID=2136401 RepID=UPI001110B453|nr:putative quinol monooxygenase [Streptomyces sp. YIM 121038]QCX82660.1 autoinducer-2 (AI-2) modifying protein LsrG [Streptomyces sp. YIM 121038]
MIFITVKFTILPERADDWLDLVDSFTQATRREPGNLFFEWSHSLDNPHQFFLVEAFRDREAGREHVESTYFKKAMEDISYAVAMTPQIVYTEIPGGNGWDKMGEVTPCPA